MMLAIIVDLFIFSLFESSHVIDFLKNKISAQVSYLKARNHENPRLCLLCGMENLPRYNILF